MFLVTRELARSASRVPMHWSQYALFFLFHVVVINLLWWAYRPVKFMEPQRYNFFRIQQSLFPRKFSAVSNIVKLAHPVCRIHIKAVPLRFFKYVSVSSYRVSEYFIILQIWSLGYFSNIVANQVAPFVTLHTEILFLELF